MIIPAKDRAICRAFTLIELVISAALMAMILTATYSCLSAALASQKLIEPRTEVAQNARVALAMLSADLRAACPLSKDYEFLGMHRMIDDVDADNLDFATHHYSATRPREADFCVMSYYVEKEFDSPDYSLYRRRNPSISLDPLSGGTRELIARGLRGVTFEYYDGFEWYDTWGEVTTDRKSKQQQSLLAANLTGMPEAVRVTLQFNPDPNGSKARWKASGNPATTETPVPPFIFQTIVRLNLAAASQSGFARDSSSGSETNSPSSTPAGRQ
jgi:prepilin-type N-terminal cleavage/methylation domain-containing protein